uniref:PhoD-like phosphatase metallophosphatase domain-containing protein n=1 Tax=Ganoderma boninense TaxID=34458 RepID=A0A5K1K1Y7_9APHY|nr:Uncharacterized protein [Ganoderma boninense]
MPIRQVDPDDKLRVWRNFKIGKLLDLTMLDTRQHDRDITDLYYNTGFYETLSESKARGAVWRVVGKSFLHTMLEDDGILDVDAWDGYRADRNRVLDHLYENKISNTIILSGDSHANRVDLAHPNQSITFVNFLGIRRVLRLTSRLGSATILSQEMVPLESNSQEPRSRLPRLFVLAFLQQMQTRSPLDMSSKTRIFNRAKALTAGSSPLPLTPISGGDILGYAQRNTNLDAFASASFVVEAKHIAANKLARPVAGGNVLADVLKIHRQ